MAERQKNRVLKWWQWGRKFPAASSVGILANTPARRGARKGGGWYQTHEGYRVFRSWGEHGGVRQPSRAMLREIVKGTQDRKEA